MEDPVLQPCPTQQPPNRAKIPEVSAEHSPKTTELEPSKPGRKRLGEVPGWGEQEQVAANDGTPGAHRLPSGARDPRGSRGPCSKKLPARLSRRGPRTPVGPWRVLPGDADRPGPE